MLHIVGTSGMLIIGSDGLRWIDIEFKLATTFRYLIILATHATDIPTALLVSSLLILHNGILERGTHRPDQYVETIFFFFLALRDLKSSISGEDSLSKKFGTIAIHPLILYRDRKNNVGDFL